MADKNTASKAKRKTKAEIYKSLADSTKLSKAQVTEVFDQLTKLILKELGKKGPGEFVLPGLLKLKTKSMPAMKRANELVHSFLLIGIQWSQTRPAVSSSVPARNSHVVRSERSRRNRRMCPAMMPNNAVAIAGSVLTRPSGSHVFVSL